MGNLRKALAERGLSTAGTKSDLTMRHQQDLRGNGEEVYNFEDPDYISGDMFLQLKALLQAQSESIESRIDTKLQAQSDSLDTKLQAQSESIESSIDTKLSVTSLGLRRI